MLSTPNMTTSLPLPSIPTPALSLLQSFKLPPPYLPPSSPSANTYESTSYPPGSTPPSTLEVSSIMSRLLEQTNGRLPFLSINSIGPISYAWRIADAALKVDEKKMGVVAGVTSEPIGQGVSLVIHSRGQIADNG